MKKLFLVFIAAAVMLGCASQTRGTDGDTTAMAVASAVDTCADPQADALVGYWGWVGDDGPELLLRLEMADSGLVVTECNIYRLYGFDNATASFDGKTLSVCEPGRDETSREVTREFRFDACLDSRGDLTGVCRVVHPLASGVYEGPLTLRKDYFKYRDAAE